jgi:hypothetical protein
MSVYLPAKLPYEIMKKRILIQKVKQALDDIMLLVIRSG